MTKLCMVCVILSIYGKTPLIIFSRNTQPITLGLALWHGGCWAYRVSSNGYPMHLNWEHCENSCFFFSKFVEAKVLYIS